MVDYTEAQLDRLLRRSRTRRGGPSSSAWRGQSGQTVTEIAAPFAVSLPAVMKHLDVLARAGLIERAKTGRTVRAACGPDRWKRAMQWLTRYERFWTSGSMRWPSSWRRRHVQTPKPKPHPQAPAQSARRQKVFAAWTNPEKIVHWFGPAETASGSVRAEMDVRVGGRYRIRFQTADGE